MVDGPTKTLVKIDGWTNSPKSVCLVPTKHRIILVVTVTGQGDNPRYHPFQVPMFVFGGARQTCFFKLLIKLSLDSCSNASN